MTCLIRDSLYFSALFGFSKLPDYFYSPGRIFFLKHLSGHWSPQSAGPPWKGPLWFPRSAGPPWKGPLWPLVSMICWPTLERAALVSAISWSTLERAALVSAICWPTLERAALAPGLHDLLVHLGKGRQSDSAALLFFPALL